MAGPDAPEDGERAEPTLPLALERFLDALRTAFDDATRDDPERRAIVERLFDDLGALDAHPAGSVRPSRLPACDHLPDALARASVGRVATLARAFAALAPALAWYRRIGSEAHGPIFHDGHANAFLIGPGGLVDRPGAAVGVSLMAPDVVYPDHHHAPEELYLVLSPGRWRHGDSDWFEPGTGGVVHNVPDIVHAMRSGDAPLLAIWCLLAERDPAPVSA